MTDANMVYENNGYWVRRSTDGYHLMQTECGYSVTESIYPLTAEGLLEAAAKCDRLGEALE